MIATICMAKQSQKLPTVLQILQDLSTSCRPDCLLDKLWDCESSSFWVLHEVTAQACLPLKPASDLHFLSACAVIACLHACMPLPQLPPGLRASVRAHPLKGMEPELLSPEELMEPSLALRRGSPGRGSHSTSTRASPSQPLHRPLPSPQQPGWFSQLFRQQERAGGVTGLSELQQPPYVRPCPSPLSTMQVVGCPLWGF